MSNPIFTENQLPGTTAWKYTNLATTEIQGYCDKTSYNPGDVVSFFASTQVGGTTYTITVYRLGWYAGAGGCQKFSSGTLTGVAQGYWNGSNQTLTNCPTAIIDSTTHLTEAGWSSTSTWTLPTSAVTGIYLVMFTDQNGKQTYTTFIVLGNSGADYAYVHSYATDQAYNSWGGWSLYTVPGTGVKVSFNRPSNLYGGAGGVLGFEVPGIKWLEAQAYNISYFSDLDINVNPSQLLNYKALLFAGHNEYWTKVERDAIEAAIASKVCAAFLGANASYWQCRLETDHSSVANRTVVCYKVNSGNNPALANDPQYGVNNALVTARWRDAVLNRPEITMIGIMYLDNTTGANQPWVVDASADHTYFAGTNLTNGASYGTDLTGYEWDAIQAGSPANIKTIATSPITGTLGGSLANTTTYIAPSGALVFASGSIAWTWGLDTFRWNSTAPGIVLGMQVLLGNILGAMKGPVYGNF